MAWSYDDTLSTDRDKVRFLVGDTDTNRQLLSNSEIDFLVTENPDYRQAAVNSCDAIIAKLSRDVDRNGPGMNATRSQQIQHYKDLKIELKKKADLYLSPLVTERDDDEETVFSIGMDDYS